MFYKHMSMTGAVIATLLAGAAQAETLTFAHGLAPNHPVAVNGFDPWMACVKEGSGGAIDFNYFPSGQIVSVQAAIDSLNEGLAQVTFVALSFASNKLPLGGVGMLPGMGDSSGQMVTAFRKMLDEGTPIAAEFEAARLQPVLINVLPPFQLATSVGPVTEVAGFRGLKTAVAGGAMNFTVTSVGGVPVEMQAPDYYLAFDRKTVDAGIMALASMNAYSMQEVMNAVSTNGNFGTAVSVLSMDLGTFRNLPPELQKVVVDCGLEVERSMAVALTENDQRLIETFKAAGVETYALSPEQKAAIDDLLSAAGGDYVARLSARGLPAQAVFDAYKAALDQ